MGKRKSGLQVTARTCRVSPSTRIVESRGAFPTRNQALRRKGNEETGFIEDEGDASVHLTVITPPPKTRKRSKVNRVTAPSEDIGIPRLVVVEKDVPDGPTVVQLQSRWKGLTLETLHSACEYLATADAKLAPLIQSHGIPERLLVKGPGAFATLSKSICFQQLATAAAAKIFVRVVEACGCTEAGILDYSSVLNTPHEALCAAGLSRNKASYLHDLARHFQAGHLSDEVIMELDTQGLHTSLTKVRGLGPWSVDMFAMFHLGLPDVLPVGDLGVRRGMQALYGLKSLPTPSQMEAIASSWQPWRSRGGNLPYSQKYAINTINTLLARGSFEFPQYVARARLDWNFAKSSPTPWMDGHVVIPHAHAFKSNEHRYLYYGLKKCDGRCFRIHCSADTSLKPKLRLSIGSANVPHPDKASYGGEDAYFVSSSGGGAMGVADGVGGWIESGINPAEYSITFMEMAKRYLEGGLDDFTGEETTPLGSLWWLDHSPSPDPIGASEVERNLPDPSVKAVEALAVAHKLTRKPGSATACVLRLVQESAELEAANVGDSGFIIIRDGEILFQSPPLQHFFDCPYQFADAPNNAPATDNAGDAQVFRIELRHGDVIILATDGLFDNVWPKDMVRSVPSCPEEVQEYAELLAHLASANGADETFESPYSVQAAAQGIDLPVWEKLSKIAFVGGKLELGRIRGGKLDDVTVLTAYVETVPV